MFHEEDFIGWKKPNARKLPCRTCRNAYPGGIAKATCLVYTDVDNNAKPENVYYENEMCPHYEEGEDLLPRELLLPPEE
jgi:hypothetical protein